MHYNFGDKVVIKDDPNKAVRTVLGSDSVWTTLERPERGAAFCLVKTQDLSYASSIKIGDSVKFKEIVTYTSKSMVEAKRTYKVEIINGVKAYCVCIENYLGYWFYLVDLEPVKVEPMKSSEFYMVWNSSGGASTGRYEKAEQAHEEAKRLVAKNPRGPFLCAEGC